MEIFTKHPQWNDVKKICTKIRENGYIAWLAGGCVRDGLMGVMPKDFDVATNARPKKIESFFNKTVDVGKAFGVVRVVEPSGDIEVATFRKDGTYSDGRRPDTVELSTPEEDAKRRDFTVNAMFYDIFEGEVYDFVGGMKDLNDKTIRAVGVAADRFMEDKLRILRAVRFVSQLDFDLEKNTLEAVRNFATAVTAVSWERIHDEIDKLVGGKRADRGLDLMLNLGLLPAIFPEVTYRREAAAFFSKILGHPHQVILGWIYLFSMISNVEEHKIVFKRLKFSADKEETVKAGLEIATSLHIFDRLTLAEKKKIAADEYSGLAATLLKLQNDLPHDVESFLKNNPHLPAALVHANDIMALGVKPGKPLGEMLDKVYDAQLEGHVKTSEEALLWIKQRFLQKQEPKT